MVNGIDAEKETLQSLVRSCLLELNKLKFDLTQMEVEKANDNSASRIRELEQDIVDKEKEVSVIKFKAEEEANQLRNQLNEKDLLIKNQEDRIYELDYVNNSLDDAYTKYSLSVLNRCANRDSTEQFFNGLPGVQEQYFLSDRDEISNKDFLGIVESYDSESNVVTLEQRNYFKPGDVVEFFGPNLEPVTFTIPDNIYDKDDNSIEVANHPKMIVKFKVPFKLCQYDMMRIKVFDISDFL